MSRIKNNMILYPCVKIQITGNCVKHHSFLQTPTSPRMATMSYVSFIPPSFQNNRLWEDVMEFFSVTGEHNLERTTTWVCGFG